MEYDDIRCSQCGGWLDTGYECNTCGYDMYYEIFGVDFTTHLSVLKNEENDSEYIKDLFRDMIMKDFEEYNY